MNGTHELRSRFRRLAESGDIQAIEDLLAQGILPRITENGENSALILAIDGGHFELVKILVQAGAQVNYATDIGETALTTACVAGRASIVAYLLGQGADIHHVDKFGVSVMEYATDHPEIQRMLTLHVRTIRMSE